VTTPEARREESPHDGCADARRHEHVFGQDRERPGERRTRVVIAITGVTMVVEIVAGLRFGSMALLADGLHMASHTAALGISALAYAWVRRHASDPAYSFGAGKMNALAGFAGAVLLAGFALLMAWESVSRLVSPVPVEFVHAIVVAVLGLLVNAVSAVVLVRGADDHDHEHGHEHEYDDHHDHGHDHNLRSAYLHVLADALTSVLAIVALFCGKWWNVRFLDPVVALVAAGVILKWTYSLVRHSGAVLLDHDPDPDRTRAIRASLESDGGTRVLDLHVWLVAPGVQASMVSVESAEPLAVEDYRARVQEHGPFAHLTVEVHRIRP